MAEVVLSNITKRFGRETALSEVSLTIPDGAVVWRFDSPHRAGERAHLVAVLYEVQRLARPAWLGR